MEKCVFPLESYDSQYVVSWPACTNNLQRFLKIVCIFFYSLQTVMFWTGTYFILKKQKWICTFGWIKPFYDCNKNKCWKHIFIHEYLLCQHEEDTKVLEFRWTLLTWLLMPWMLRSKDYENHNLVNAINSIYYMASHRSIQQCT